MDHSSISSLRAKLSGVGKTGTDANSNPFSISNGDINAQAYRRTSRQVLNIAYGVPSPGVTGNGFFPNGVRGTIVSA